MNRKTWAVVIGALAGLTFLTGCSTPKAPLSASGQKIKIAVLSDRGNEKEMESKQWGYRNEVGSYMETDLINRLNSTGYDAKLIGSRGEYAAGVDSYLVYMKIKSYNPGSAAARYLVGLGAGACSLDMHYSVFGPNEKAILDWDDGIGTSGDWRRIPISLNNKLVVKLNTELVPKP